jgi:hypothetical protein
LCAKFRPDQLAPHGSDDVEHRGVALLRVPGRDPTATLDVDGGLGAGALVAGGLALIALSGPISTFFETRPYNRPLLWAFGDREGARFFNRMIATLIGAAWAYVGISHLT